MNIPPKYYPLSIFLLLAAGATIIAAGLYTITNQIYRSAANDPQIEAVQEIAQFISESNAPLEAVIDPSRQTDLTTSLGTFVNVYDNDKQLIAGTGLIGENVATPPDNAFEVARQQEDNRFTWEPEEGIRIAAVMKQANDDAGFILAGRSLAEVDKRQLAATNHIGITWVVLLILAGLLTWIITKMTGNTFLDEAEADDSSNSETIVVEETVTISSGSGESESDKN